LPDDATVTLERDDHILPMVRTARRSATRSTFAGPDTHGLQCRGVRYSRSADMPSSPELAWQPSLLAVAETVEIDRSFSRLTRIQLDGESWVDHVPGWVPGADLLFERILASRGWQQRSRHMYDKRVLEPRLTASWNARSGEPLEPPVLEDVLGALSERYARRFDSVGFNLYRDGGDSVAWHGDRIDDRIEDPIVALVSLGEPRAFLLRPKGGGRSRPFALGHGDLLVTGGKTQRTWDHSVPKVARAGPRISLAFRHDMDAAAYTDDRPGGKGPVSAPRRGAGTSGTA
jgi:alkylated DNA repair dioxygenase AlkB